MLIYICHWLIFFTEIILFLGKLLYKLRNLRQLLLVWKNPTQYTESRIRMSLRVQIAVKIPYLRYCHLNDWKVLKFEKNCILIFSVINFLSYRCLLDPFTALWHGVNGLCKRISLILIKWGQRKLVVDVVFLDFSTKYEARQEAGENNVCYKMP